MLSAFGRFNERGGGGAVRLRPIQRAGGGGCCPPSADSTSGGGGVLSAFGRFNERGGGGGEVTVIDRAHAQYRRVNLLI